MPGYIHGHHESVLRSHRWRTAENSAAYILDKLRPGMSILDVGCGPGTLTLDLARRVAPGRVIGVDISGSVLAEARRNVAEAGNVEIIHGDVLDLDFGDGAFDLVHAHQLLQHLADPVSALAEMARVSKPDGLIAVREGDYGGMTWWPAEPGLDRWMALYRETARHNHGVPDAGRRLLGWAMDAGLVDVSASASVWCFATPEDRAWWGGTWAERVSDSDLARQAVSLGIASEGELEEIAGAWRRWAEVPDAWFAVVHGEIVASPP